MLREKKLVRDVVTELYNSGVSAYDIAIKMNRSINTIYCHLQGVKKRHNVKKVTTEQIEAEIKKCSSSNEVCKNLGISKRLYYQHIKGNRFVRDYDKFNRSRKTVSNDVKELHSQGLTNLVIAERLSLNVNYVCQVIRRLGLTSNRKERKFDVKKLKELFDNKHQIKYIAEELGITPTTCHNTIKELGLTRVIEKPVKEKKVKIKKLTVDEVKEFIIKGWSISKLVDKGLCTESVANRFMKKAKQIIPAEISRDMLGKGFERGEVKAVKLREDRDSGRLVKFKYSDLSDYPTVLAEIRVKDEVSDQEAIERWCKKHNKKSWKLV